MIWAFMAGSLCTVGGIVGVGFVVIIWAAREADGRGNE
jgi:hypothetical protein